MRIKKIGIIVTGCIAFAITMSFRDTVESTWLRMLVSCLAGGIVGIMFVLLDKTRFIEEYVKRRERGKRMRKY